MSGPEPSSARYYSPMTLFAMYAILGTAIGAALGHKDHYILNERQKIVDDNSDEIIEMEELVEVEVQSVQIKDQFIIVKWNDKNIRLSSSEVIQWNKSGEKILLTLPLEVYQRVFNNEQ